MLISLTYSLTMRHPNSLKQNIDFSMQGNNWPGTCKSGSHQSPIDINKFDKVPNNLLTINYQKESGMVEFNGSFYRIDLEGKKSKIAFKNLKTKKKTEYTLKRIIFKTPAEHEIEGTKHDMEMQLVHQTDQKVPQNILIVSLFAKSSKSPKNVHDFWKGIDFYGKDKSDLSMLKRLMEESNEYYVYDGSQTVPNCVENVK